MLHALFDLSGLGRSSVLSGPETDAPLPAPAEHVSPVLRGQVDEEEWEDDEEEFEEEDERPGRRREDDW